MAAVLFVLLFQNVGVLDCKVTSPLGLPVQSCTAALHEIGENTCGE